jgi:hypothetical protein
VAAWVCPGALVPGMVWPGEVFVIVPLDPDEPPGLDEPGSLAPAPLLEPGLLLPDVEDPELDEPLVVLPGTVEPALLEPLLPEIELPGDELPEEDVPALPEAVPPVDVPLEPPCEPAEHVDVFLVCLVFASATIGTATPAMMAAMAVMVLRRVKSMSSCSVVIVCLPSAWRNWWLERVLRGLYCTGATEIRCHKLNVVLMPACRSRRRRCGVAGRHEIDPLQDQHCMGLEPRG